MSEPTYYKLKRKLEKIQKWVYQKQWEFTSDVEPEDQIVQVLMNELQVILDEAEKTQG